MTTMQRLSTGQPATLGTYRDIARVLAGTDDSEAVRYFDQKISESRWGRDEEVLAHESQMMHFIGSLITKDIKDELEQS
jgi:hypothetical protein